MSHVTLGADARSPAHPGLLSRVCQRPRRLASAARSFRCSVKALPVLGGPRPVSRLVHGADAGGTVGGASIRGRPSVGRRPATDVIAALADDADRRCHPYSEAQAAARRPVTASGRAVVSATCVRHGGDGRRDRRARCVRAGRDTRGRQKPRAASDPPVQCVRPSGAPRKRRLDHPQGFTITGDRARRGRRRTVPPIDLPISALIIRRRRDRRGGGRYLVRATPSVAGSSARRSPGWFRRSRSVPTAGHEPPADPQTVTAVLSMRRLDSVQLSAPANPPRQRSFSPTTTRSCVDRCARCLRPKDGLRSLRRPPTRRKPPARYSPTSHM